MSVRAVLRRRVEQAMSKVTISAFTNVALPILFVGATMYGGIISYANSHPGVPEEDSARTFASLLLLGLEIVVAVSVTLALIKTIWDIGQEAREYAQKLGPEPEQVSQIDNLVTRLQESTSQQVRELAQEVRTKLERAEIALADTSEPDKLFQVARQRLLDEAIRLDKISRRNLIIGIVFSFVALGTLASPLISGLLQTAPEPVDSGVMPWIAHYYLPRFAIGLLLQLVGFFFLRLYVANELDLKHNKNEITNIELRMMGLQLARTDGDAASRKDVIKSLMNTERNFIIKKSEKTVSTEALTEYNDLKGLIEKLISKIPGAGKSTKS
jgi:hypothetical protein